MKIKNKLIDVLNKEDKLLKEAEGKTHVRNPFAFRSEVSNKIYVF